MDRLKQFGKRLIYLFDSLLCAFFLRDKKILSLDRAGGLTSNASLALLYLFASDCPVEGDILEIGSFSGSSALALALGNKFSRKESKVWLIESFPRPDKDSFLRRFRDCHLDEDIILVDKSSQEARKVISAKLRLIFIDGDHYYEPLKNDIMLWGGLLQEGGIIALHDFQNPYVARAIKELIVESGNFTVYGSLGAVLYAAKGKFQDMALLRRLAGLEKIRKRIINFANISGIAYLLRGKKLRNS